VPEQVEPQPEHPQDEHPNEQWEQIPHKPDIERMREKISKGLCQVDNAACLKINPCFSLNCILTKKALDRIMTVIREEING
jgi:hypothetical protein